MPMRAVSVGTTPTEIAEYNPLRLALAIHNDGNDRVFVSHDPQNVSSQGWPLDPGVMVSFSVADGDQPWLRLFAQAASGTQPVRIYEGYGT
jgi:hypothetical protein